MAFVAKTAKGLNKVLMDESIVADRLTVHISEVGPGLRAHPPHTHTGIEGFYILEGQGAVELGDERQTVGPNELVLVGAETLHGLANVGEGVLRYMVIIARP
jgi:mannose-6-phosphate isomerase-like protein (cupin superfamily)